MGATETVKLCGVRRHRL